MVEAQSAQTFGAFGALNLLRRRLRTGQTNRQTFSAAGSDSYTLYRRRKRRSDSAWRAKLSATDHGRRQQAKLPARMTTSGGMDGPLLVLGLRPHTELRALPGAGWQRWQKRALVQTFYRPGWQAQSSWGGRTRLGPLWLRRVQTRAEPREPAQLSDRASSKSHRNSPDLNLRISDYKQVI